MPAPKRPRRPSPFLPVSVARLRGQANRTISLEGKRKFLTSALRLAKGTPAAAAIRDELTRLGRIKIIPGSTHAEAKTFVQTLRHIYLTPEKARKAILEPGSDFSIRALASYDIPASYLRSVRIPLRTIIETLQVAGWDGHRIADYLERSGYHVAASRLRL